MVEVVAVSDIHGNAPALRAIIQEEGAASVFTCSGDIVGLLGFNSECVQLAQDVFDYAVLGNHDLRVRDDTAFSPSSSKQRIEQTVVQEQLTSNNLTYVNSLPNRVDNEEHSFLLAHSWPVSLNAGNKTICGTSDTDHGVTKKRATELGPYLEGRTAILGHTHNQYTLDVSQFNGQDGLIVNPGSAGVRWNEPAEYAIIDLDSGDVSLRTVDYEYEEVEERIRELETLEAHESLRSNRIL